MSRNVLDQELLDAVRREVLARPGPVTPAAIAEALRASGRVLGVDGALAAVEAISAELSGLGPLQPLARESGVTDILVNGPRQVWADKGSGLERVPVEFVSEESLRSLAVRLLAAGGRRLDDTSPCADVTLDGGYRVHAVLPPISTSGTLLSVRIRRERRFTLEELEAGGAVHSRIRGVLERIVGCRLNLLVSGSTGSGKTTLLSALLGLADPDERIVLVEDAAELLADHEHVVGLEARHGNVEGRGAIGLAELVRNALRMRPDRLVVGECRGAEVRDLLTALNTGHSGGAGTIHANTAASVAARLMALGALAGLNSEATTLQAASALDVVVHVERSSAGRRVTEIAVVEEAEGRLQIATAIAWPWSSAEPVLGPAWEALAGRLGYEAGSS